MHKAREHVRSLPRILIYGAFLSALGYTGTKTPVVMTSRSFSEAMKETARAYCLPCVLLVIAFVWNYANGLGFISITLVGTAVVLVARISRTRALTVFPNIMRLPYGSYTVVPPRHPHPAGKGSDALVTVLRWDGGRRQYLLFWFAGGLREPLHNHFQRNAEGIGPLLFTDVPADVLGFPKPEPQLRTAGPGCLQPEDVVQPDDLLGQPEEHSTSVH